MRKLELLPTWNCEAGYGPVHVHFLSEIIISMKSTSKCIQYICKFVAGYSQDVNVTTTEGKNDSPNPNPNPNMPPYILYFK